ncbi:hypothetical protein GCM10023322_35490 [Rugosimonospora acidiphila]|uniref:Uncharacterized protein n=1 Tax=Rugosimonospora acidiphila TaxID=556531 RepID=A0ABP9RWK4_9ACTN
MSLRLGSAAVVALALAGGAGTLMPDLALADELSVDFTGGCKVLSLGATSQPDTASLDLTAGSALWVVNRLGVQATLMLDGQGTDSIGPDQSSRLTLATQGTETVQLVPVCPLPLTDIGPLTIRVSPDSPGGTPSAAPSATAPPPQPSPPATTAPPSSSRPQPAPHPRPTQATGTAPARAPAPHSSSRTNRHNNGRTPTPTVGTSEPESVAEFPPEVPTGPVPQAGPPLIWPVTPLTDDRGFRYSLALIACVFIIGTGTAAIRLLISSHHVGTHRSP